MDITVGGPDDDGNAAANITYGFPDTSSPSQRRLFFSVQRVGGSTFVSDPISPGSVTGVWAFPWGMSCATPGTYVFKAVASSCGGERVDSQDVIHEAQPAVSVTYSGPDAEGHGKVIVNYNFPKTFSVDQRTLTHRREGGGVIVSGATLHPTQRQGTWEFDYSMTCLTGTYTHVVTATHCNGLVAQGRADVTTDTTPTAAISLGEADENANMPVYVDYSFPNTDLSSQRKVWVTVRYPGGAISVSDPFRPAQQSGVWATSVNLACQPAEALTITASAESCNGLDQESTTYTPQHDGTVDAHVDPENPRSLTAQYRFTGTATNSQRVLQLRWPDETVIESKQVSNAEGETSFTFPACASEDRRAVKIVAIACGERRGESGAVPIPQCERSCSIACPDCVGSPIRITSGNMRMSDSDPLPGRTLAPLGRTYDSRRTAAGAFGRGWTSIFDASLKISGRSALIETGEGELVVFTSAQNVYTQTYPAGQAIATSLTYDAITALYTYHDARTERKFRSGDGRLVSIRELPSPYEITIMYDAEGRPSRVVDTSSAWSWTITPGALGTVASITVDDEPNLTWTYAYAPDGSLQSVDSPVGRWRTYTYGPSGLTEAKDGVDHLIEGHDYDAAGRATTSIGNVNDVQSIAYDLPGRVAGETKTRVVNAAGEPTDYYSRFTGGKMRTVQIVGACSCGTDDAVYVHDESGRVIREQNARGYITQRGFDGDLLTSETTAMRPANCDPALDAAHCRLDPDTLRSAPLSATSASLTRTFAYGDANWPDRPTRIQMSSVLQPGAVTEQRFTYDAVSGIVLLESKTGWTGQPARQETRTTVTVLYDGGEPAAFNPGGLFQRAWMSLPQPQSQRKTLDGPRTDVNDVTTFVYYPLDASVPLRLRGRLAAIRNAAGQLTRFESYDAFGNETRTVDPNGVATELSYDGLGRVSSTTVKGVSGCDTAADPLCAADLTSSRTYSGAGPLSSQSFFGPGITVFEHDTRRRVTAISRGPSPGDLRERMETDYDPATGHKQSERWLAREDNAWAQKRSESYRYDGLGNLTEVIHPDGTSASYGYGPQREVLTVRDENHTLPNTIYRHDAAARLSSVVQTLATAPGGTISTRYTYDVHGNLTSVTDPNGNVTTYVYDDFGAVLRQNSTVSGVTTYAYDTAGQLVSTADANGATTTRVHDALGRPIRATSTRGTQSETVSWTYDSGTFGAGRVSSMSDPTGSAVYAYDRRGLLLSEEKTIQGALYTSRFQYDGNGSRNRIIYPSGAQVDFGLDYAGRPISATRGESVLALSARYLPFGPMTELVYGNGTRMTVAFDRRYRNTTRTLVGSSGTFASYSYRHDSAGNITQIADVADPRFTRDFVYDDLHRLTVANSGSGLWGAGSYAYDAMGNMLALSLGSARTAAFGYEATTPKLTAVTENGVIRTVSYDAAGNEVVVGSESFGYSPRNHLLSADNVSYMYDGRGIRTVTSRVIPPPSLASFTIAPATVIGGTDTTATIVLSSAAPQGVVVELASSNPAVSVPAFVLVPEGSTSANALITSSPVVSDIAATITATFGASVETASLNVKAPRVLALDITPPQVTGGTAASGTITLDGVAPEGDVSVALSSNAAVASVASNVLIPAGAVTAAFPVSTSTVSSQTTAAITATLLGSARTANLTIVPSGLARLRFTPASLHGGSTATGTAELSGPAPAGGALIALSSSAPELAVSATVLIPEGSASADFTMTASPVEAAANVVVTTSYLGTSQSGVVTIVPPDLISFEVTPAMTIGGENATARATLDSAAAPAGGTVAITSSDTNLVPAATLTVPDGATQGVATLPTNAVPSATPVVVSATRNGITRSSVVTLQPSPVTLASLTVNPASLVGSNQATATVTLTNPAPADGLEVELTTSDPARASVPSSVIVAAGSTQATFSISTAVVASQTPVTITALHGITTKTAILTLLAPASNYLSSLSITPQYITGGQTAAGTVTLASPSTVSGGSDVTLTSSDPSVVVPSLVTIKKNRSSETFIVTTSAVSAPKSAVITAAYGGVIQQTNVIVAPQNTIILASFTIAPLRVVGGNPSAGTVTLNAPAPPGGAVVAITTKRRNMISVPQSITITEGVTSATFAIGTDVAHGNHDRSVAIDATYNGVSRTATLTIAPVSSASRTAVHAALCASPTIAPCVMADTVRAVILSVAPQQQYSLYSPELSLLAETQSTPDGAPTVAYEYVWFAGVPVAQIELPSGTIHSYFNDHLGMPVLTTNESGMVDWRVEREPYGENFVIRTESNRHQPLAFPGQENDGTAKRSYNIFRWYRASWGRYTQFDPTGIASDVNPYRYARTRPLRLTDARGLQAHQPCPLGSAACILCRNGQPDIFWNQTNLPEPFRTCIEEHERDHMQFWNTETCGACRGVPDGQGPRLHRPDPRMSQDDFTDYAATFRARTECSAFHVEYDCLARNRSSSTNPSAIDQRMADLQTIANNRFSCASDTW